MIIPVSQISQSLPPVVQANKESCALLAARLKRLEVPLTGIISMSQKESDPLQVRGAPRWKNIEKKVCKSGCGPRSYEMNKRPQIWTAARHAYSTKFQV